MAAMIATQVQVIFRDQENAEGVTVAIVAGETLENGSHVLRFLRMRGHVVPLGKSCGVWVYTSEIYAVGLAAATPSGDRLNPFGLPLFSSGSASKLSVFSLVG